MEGSTGCWGALGVAPGRVHLLRSSVINKQGGAPKGTYEYQGVTMNTREYHNVPICAMELSVKYHRVYVLYMEIYGDSNKAKQKSKALKTLHVSF